MSQVHRILNCRGTRIHAVADSPPDQQGPLVVLLHGFPESWYSWRHQIPALAGAGYRVVAIDQRGYGRSSKYRVQKAYRIKELVGDVVGVLDSYGAEQAFVVGHDWGAPVAWTFAWLHPDRCAGVVGISVPFAGRGVIGLPGSPFGERRPSDYHLELAGPGRVWYQDYFAVQDGIITEIEEDLRGWLLGLTYTVSGEGMMAATKAAVDAGVDLESMDPIDVIRAGPLCMAEGARLKDAFVYPETMPAWFTEADLDFYTGEFERSGFGGPLSFYHNIDNDWHDLADQQGKPLTPPALFIGGQYDVGTIWGAQAIERAHEVMPNYRGTHMIADVGHWIQQEAPEETNRLLRPARSRSLLGRAPESVWRLPGDSPTRAAMCCARTSMVMPRMPRPPKSVVAQRPAGLTSATNNRSSPWSTPVLPRSAGWTSWSPTPVSFIWLRSSTPPSRTSIGSSRSISAAPGCAPSMRHRG